jgi:general nucleoside transport system ATP-binding protein
MTLELELRGITKRYPGVIANDSIDLQVRPGEIHAVVGENGAGKTTLMSILYGLVAPDEGEILVRGEPVRLRSALDAIDHGLGMVHQAFKLFPTLTVAENIVFRSEPTRRGMIDRRAAEAKVAELAAANGLVVDPSARVEDLAVGVLQRVEILKALYRDAKVLILDEPTAVLTPQERDTLFEVMKSLRANGRTILFVTHKLNEVMAISDRVTVLRNGRVAADMLTIDTSPAEISHHMTGRDVDLERPHGLGSPGEVVLEVSGLTVVGEHELEVVSDVSFEVRSGEIVGIAGVAGNGQSELIEAIAGLRGVDGGSVRVAGQAVTTATVADRRRAGMTYIPEDRHRVGTAAPSSIASNLLMGFQRRFSQRGWIDRAAVDGHADELVQRFGIKAPSAETPVATLSGGNLQKVVVAREMSHPDGKLLLAEQPTRGVDVGAIEFIHGRLVDFRDAGGAVLLVSAELWEIRALATRILVMYEGRIVGEVEPSTAEADLGLMMTGAGSV